MLGKSEMSFIFLWILNPMVILFYQNCSWAPPSRAEATAAKQTQAQAPSSCTSQWSSQVCPE